MKKLIIIPAYNEGECIERTIQDIEKHAQGFDYLIVNDCSTDNTREICEKNCFNRMNLPINLGIGGAVQTGYRYAWEHGYDMAVQFDGDGQHDASFLPRMSEAMVKEGADMLIGSRFIEREGFQSSFIRRVGITYFTGLIRVLTGKTITDPTSGLRMINRSVLEIFAKDYPKDYPEPESVVAVLRNKKRVKEIPVVMRERQGGSSSIGNVKSVYYMVKVTLAILVESLRRYK